MATPAFKASAYLAELSDPTVSLSKGRLEWILADMKRMAEAESHDLAAVHGGLCLAYYRLGRHEKALQHCRTALHHAPANVDLALFASAILLQLRRPVEALDLLAAIHDQQGHKQVVLLCNTASALVDLGLLADAREVFEEALRVAEHDDAASVLGLAVLASICDADREAVELFARYLRLKQGEPRGREHPLTVIRNASDEHRAVLSQVGTLRLGVTVMKALALGHALFDAAPAPSFSVPAGEIAMDDADAMAVYQDTLPLRSKATREVMGEGEHGA